MKTSTKVTVGFSVAAIAGIATTVIVTDQVVKKVLQLSNRRKVKNFVKVKLKGNEKLLDLVDHLDDDDISNLIKTGEKIGKSYDRVTHYGENVKENTVQAKEKLTDIVTSIF